MSSLVYFSVTLNVSPRLRLTGDAHFASSHAVPIIRLRVPRQQHHHYKVMLSLEPMNEGVESSRFIIVLVHLVEFLSGVFKIVASEKSPWLPALIGGLMLSRHQQRWEPLG
jgi:hypothetical protein